MIVHNLNIREVKALAKSKGVNKLLSVDSDPKTAKSNASGKGYYTAILYLAPHKLSGYNVCPSAKDCPANCLHYGGNPVYYKGKVKARIARTKFFFEHRPEFFILLVHEIRAFVRKCEKLGLKPVIRLNGTSDIVWEKVAPWLFAEFKNVVFYDYTKLAKRVRPDWVLPSNYSLTFSRENANKIEAEGLANSLANVAVVFRSKRLPDTFWGRPVVNGDETDLRFLDPQGVIVGLSAKGPAKKDTSGFVVDA